MMTTAHTSDITIADDTMSDHSSSAKVKAAADVTFVSFSSFLKGLPVYVGVYFTHPCD